MESLKNTNQTNRLIDLDTKLLYKWSGISAIILVISYIIIIVLYVFSGVPPTGGEEWLKHITGHTAEWWSILGLSVFTDLIYIPVAYSLYVLLKEVNKNAMLAGLGFFILFVFLDLAITWTNYSSLITLSGKYAAANDSQRETIIAIADYVSAVVSSSLISIYIILFPAIGILIFSLVMLKGKVSKTTAYLGVVTGILGVISIAGPFFISSLGILVVITSILTTVWFMLIGYRLLRLGLL
jgi:Domain of unknown function (DUF4386)